MTNADLTRIINSDEIQSAVRQPKAATTRHAPLKKNPLKNLGAMLKLNPYAKAARRMEVRRAQRHTLLAAATGSSLRLLCITAVASDNC